MPLSRTLLEMYGGRLSFPAARPHVYANFVSTIDGLVSYGLPGRSSARLISGGAAPDRAVMGLLRACADVVVSGAATLRVERNVAWTPWQIFPALADDYRGLRRALGRPERVSVAIVSASGDLDASLPVFNASDADAFIVTTERGGRVASRAFGSERVEVIPGDAPSMQDVIRAIVTRAGGGLVLSEVGPRLFGLMLRDSAVDELFLTVAPQLAGRSSERPGIPLVNETAFAPERASWARAISAKRAEDLILLRYSFERAPTAGTKTAVIRQ